jgi:hypothetical protein
MPPENGYADNGRRHTTIGNHVSDNCHVVVDIELSGDIYAYIEGFQQPLARKNRWHHGYTSFVGSAVSPIYNGNFIVSPHMH